MATYLENLTTERDAIQAQLAAMVAKPSYDVDGQRVEWTSHYNALANRLKEIKAELVGDSPFEEQSQGYT